ncbi:unnamed protein product, partial [Toxocara canis]|uniref:Bravo_FIGEY domain-containing protein n=1 Tax=Toxocara canis TaxID=6265 RepID=A0A183U1P8_TOXCA
AAEQVRPVGETQGSSAVTGSAEKDSEQEDEQEQKTHGDETETEAEEEYTFGSPIGGHVLKSVMLTKQRKGEKSSSTDVSLSSAKTVATDDGTVKYREVGYGAVEEHEYDYGEGSSDVHSESYPVDAPNANPHSTTGRGGSSSNAGSDMNKNTNAPNKMYSVYL